ncbi:MAG: ABC transporter substrate-binding protein [Gaiellales bacterium]
MIARRLLWMAGIAAVLVAAGCGGAGGSQAGSATSGGPIKKGGLLRIGTNSQIDSLNPFNAINSQAYNAFVMEYPQLVQYGPGQKLVGDWAKSWKPSADGKTWTFDLIGGGKWSDGQPLTAADAAWTCNTIIKYAGGSSSYLAAALSHATSCEAPDATTFVIHYEKAVANVLPQLEQFWVLPEHVWSKLTGNKGKDLQTYKVDQHLPTVAAGPYQITQFQEKGTTVFKPNPGFYGPKSNAQAVAMTYYTNSTSMVADFRAGNLDFIDSVPYDAASAVKSGANLYVGTGAEVTNITFNSNPAKPKNRELLDPRVKEALEYATDRATLIDKVYAGYAVPYANLISLQSKTEGWLNPAVQPLPFDLAKANQMLDSLGYAKGSGGIRVVPATTGKYAQPSHKMEYDVMVPTSLDYNGDRSFQIIANTWAKAGVKLHEVAGGDTSQAYSYETAGNYTKFDMALWDWVGYIDPDFMLSVLTRSQWFSWSDTGFNDPQYNAWYKQQGTLTDFKQRQALVWQMEKFVADQRPYIQVANTKTIAASGSKWTGFYPDLSAYCKCYYTSPHLS